LETANSIFQVLELRRYCTQTFHKLAKSDQS